MTLRFGTDGLRGVAGRELTPELAQALGRAAGRRLGRPGGAWLIGRDTRRSGPMLQAALAAGLAAEGVDVVDVGVIPTPGVAALAAAYGTPAAMISASHNPFADNGIKLFATGGRKLTDEVEAALEADLLSARPELRSGLDVGGIAADPDALGWYRRQVVAGLEGRRLDGIRVAVDCGHGAATVTAGAVLEAAGAEVVDLLG
ncbi:MAG: phosphoglucosamine mutase, partial [Acidimicrobiales bacterium]